MTLQKVTSRPQRGWRLLAIAMVASSAFMPPPAAARVLSRSPHASPAGTHGTASLLVHTMPGTTRAQVRVSTLLFVPAGRAPAGGWPIVAWAHGSTTPGSRVCAPSLSPDFDGGLTASGAKSDYGDEIASLVNVGYAVVAPDYEGLGAVKSKGAAKFRGILPGWADAPLMKRFLQANDPADMPALTIRHPMLIVAGTNDDFVPVEPLRKLVAAQRTLGAPITLVLQPGGNHFSIIKGRRDDVMRFIATMFSKLPAKTSL